MKDLTNRYLIFGYNTYYPVGGIHDLEGSAATIEEAQQLAKQGDIPDYIDIVDKETMAIVAQGFQVHKPIPGELRGTLSISWKTRIAV